VWKSWKLQENENAKFAKFAKEIGMTLKSLFSILGFLGVLAFQILVPREYSSRPAGVMHRNRKIFRLGPILRAVQRVRWESESEGKGRNDSAITPSFAFHAPVGLEYRTIFPPDLGCLKSDHASSG